MKRPLVLFGGLAATVGIVAGSLVSAPLTGASSHREAPMHNLLGDGVNQSAQPFNAAFPYLSQPYSGFSRAGGTATSPTGAP